MGFGDFSNISELSNVADFSDLGNKGAASLRKSDPACVPLVRGRR
jgi:hypothetical protein